MITIGRIPKIAAAAAAFGVNLALAAGLASLAHHYEVQAASGLRAGGATPLVATAQCRPERAAPG